MYYIVLNPKGKHEHISLVFSALTSRPTSLLCPVSLNIKGTYQKLTCAIQIQSFVLS